MCGRKMGCSQNISALMFLPSLRATAITGTEFIRPDYGKMAPEADFSPAQDRHNSGGRLHRLDKARNTFAPAMNLRKQTAEITGLGDSYPPAEWSKADFRAAVKRLTAEYPEIARLIYLRGTQRAAEKNWKDALQPLSGYPQATSRHS